MSDIHQKVGQRIQKYRVKAKLSQEELAFKAGVHRAYIGQIERAEKKIRLRNLEKITNALKISLAKFLEKI